jgi:lipopolysaccharide/colanic/teichoic acid biosynthesis glycosyltransferase
MRIETLDEAQGAPVLGGLCELGELTLSFYERVKCALEPVFAAALLIFFSPVLLITMLGVKLTSRGPVVYSQTRVGRNGRNFRIYKLRSMYHDCERTTGPQWSTKHDPRVTPFGRFLRKSHLDEFPQLWNVIRGEMSLIGPRPERPEIVPQLSKAIPHYQRRLLVRPGLTGLAQVQLPPDTDLGSVRRKLVYDLYYIKKAGPLVDLQILVSTGFLFLGIPTAVSCKLLRVPGGAKIEGTYQSDTGEFEPVPQMQTA